MKTELRSVCTTLSFVWWLISVLSRSCRGLDETVGSGDTGNVSNTTERFEVLPGLYGVIAASGLIFSVVITLICCTMILVHGKIVPQKAKVTLHKLRQHEEEDAVPQYHHQPEIQLSSYRKVNATPSSTAEDRHTTSVSPDNGFLLGSRQTTV